MNAKCGNLERAKNLFKTTPKRDLITYCSMMQGMSIHGRGRDTVSLFNQMLNEGLAPDGVVSAASDERRWGLQRATTGGGSAASDEKRCGGGFTATDDVEAAFIASGDVEAGFVTSRTHEFQSAQNPPRPALICQDLRLDPRRHVRKDDDDAGWTW